MAQSLTVVPVNVELSPGQAAVSLTVVNQGAKDTSVQIRAYSWNQSGPGGADVLTESKDMVSSPPVTTIAPAAAQVIRMVLKQPPKGQEATYRVLVDQIPGPAQPGTVQIALRLSIPVFAEPDARATPRVKYHVERNGAEAYLVAMNEGGRHDTVRDITLKSSDGAIVKTENNASPYVLAGATRRWRIADAAHLPAAGSTLHLIAHADSGAIDEQVPVQGS